MNKILTVIVTVYGLLFFACSMGPIAGGGSDLPDTKVVIGTIYNKNNSPAVNTQVIILPQKYNALIDGPVPDSLIDTTDASGSYSFTLPGNHAYTIEAVHLSQRTRLLIKGITAVHDTVVAPSDTLKEPGFLKVFLPDTVDTVNQYVYIKGATIVKNLNGGTFYTGGFYVIVIDSVPADQLPSITLASRKPAFTPVTLSDTTVVIPGDTTIIGTDTIQKPIWAFPLIMGVTTATVNHYNGFDAIKAKIGSQLTIVNNYFNDPAVFEGVFNFYIDSMYEFSTPVPDEFNKPIVPYAMRVIYDQNGQPSLPYWEPFNRVIYIAVNIGNGDDLFNNQTSRNVTWLLGLARGCVGYAWITVDSSGNPFNGAPYTAIESIMTEPQKTTKWDLFNIHIINYYKNRFSIIPEIYNRAFPSSMGVSALSNTGQPVQNVRVDLFGIKWASYTVSNVSAVSGVTDSNGEFIFTLNPFTAGSDTTVYGNFLIRAVSSNDTAYTWLPINEPGNAWFANPDTLYRTEIQF